MKLSEIKDNSQFETFYSEHKLNTVKDRLQCLQAMTHCTMYDNMSDEEALTLLEHYILTEWDRLSAYEISDVSQFETFFIQHGFNTVQSRIDFMKHLLTNAFDETLTPEVELLILELLFLIKGKQIWMKT